jgi:uncharacterized membrane protein
MLSVLTTTCLLLASLAAGGDVPPTIVVFGSSEGPTYAHDMSWDGTVVTGRTGEYPYIWRETSGMEILPRTTFIPSAISGDGTTIAGYDTALRLAHKWTRSGGFVNLGDLPTGQSISYPYGVSFDGGTIVGHGAIFFLDTQAFAWTTSGGMVGLPFLEQPHRSSWANGVSADGSVVVGWCNYNANVPGQAAVRWTAAGIDVIPGFQHGQNASADHVSAAGDVVFGQINGREFVWRAGGQPFHLGELGIFNASSPDGSFAVGNGRPGAWIWDPMNGRRVVEDTLVALGAPLPQGAWISSVRSISANNRTVCGELVTADGRVNGYVAGGLPLPGDHVGDLNADGRVNVRDTVSFFNCHTGPVSAILVGCTPADLEQDADVDLRDYAELQRLSTAGCVYAADLTGDCVLDSRDWNRVRLCLNGPVTYPSDIICLLGDYDFDGDVDLVDVAAFQRHFGQE